MNNLLTFLHLLLDLYLPLTLMIVLCYIDIQRDNGKLYLSHIYTLTKYVFRISRPRSTLQQNLSPYEYQAYNIIR